VALASASDAFPGAPQTQAHGYGVATDACRSLRPIATCRRAQDGRGDACDINGDGRPDLILLYSKLSRHHVGGLGASSEFRRDYLAEAAYLTVYLAGGGSATTRIVGTRSAAIIAVSHMSDDPGSEVFLQVSEISSGSAAFVYSFNDGRLVRRRDPRLRRRLRNKGRVQLPCRSSTPDPETFELLGRRSTAGGGNRHHLHLEWPETRANSRANVQRTRFAAS